MDDKNEFNEDYDEQSRREYEQGRSYYKNNQRDAAMKAFVQSWITMQHGKTAYWIARCRSERGDARIANEWLWIAHELSPRNDLIAYALAESEVEAGHYETAYKLLTGILKRNADYKKAMILLTRISLQ